MSNLNLRSPNRILSELIISMKYSVPPEAEYFVVLSFRFVFIFLLSLRAIPISLNLISTILDLFLSMFFSISWRISMFLIPAIR